LKYHINFIEPSKLFWIRYLKDTQRYCLIINTMTASSSTPPSTPRKAHKVVLIGDSQCGKSSLLRRYTRKSFEEDYMPTVFDSGSADIVADQNNDIQVNIWDTSGSGEYDHVRPLSFGEATVFIVCFDITKSTTLENIQRKWLPEIRQRHADRPIILVGCKSDLKADQKLTNIHKRLVLSSQGLLLAKHIGAIAYYECSSKVEDTPETINSLFETAAMASTGSLGKISKEHRIKFDKKKNKAYEKCTIS